MSLRFRCQNSKCRKFVAIDKKLCACGADIPREYWFVKNYQGRRFTKCFGKGTRLEAECSHKKWLIALIQSLTAPPPQRILLSQMADTYVRYLESSGKRYAYEARLFLERLIEYVGDIPYQSLTIQQLSNWQTHLRNRGLSAAYCDRHIQIVKAAWNRSLPDTPNPTRHVRLFKPDNIIVERLTSEEEKKLLLAAQCLNGNTPWHFYEILLTAIHTGMRMRNVLHLHRSEVDFDNRVITIRQKGNRVHRVPMNQELYETLRRIKPPHGGSGWFFPSLTAKGKPLNDVRKSFEEAKKIAGITRPFRFHGLRHHFGTKLLARTKNLPLVKKAMGHSDIKMTMRYAHVLDDEVREALESLVPSQ